MTCEQTPIKFDIQVLELSDLPESCRSKQLRYRWKRGDKGGSGSAVTSSHTGSVSWRDRIEFNSTLMFNPSKGYETKKFSLSVLDALASKEIGRLKLDLAVVYSRILKAEKDELTRSYDFRVTDGKHHTATLRLHFRVTVLDYSVPPSAAPSGLEDPPSSKGSVESHSHLSLSHEPRSHSNSLGGAKPTMATPDSRRQSVQSAAFVDLLSQDDAFNSFSLSRVVDDMCMADMALNIRDYTPPSPTSLRPHLSTEGVGVRGHRHRQSNLSTELLPTPEAADSAQETDSTEDDEDDDSERVHNNEEHPPARAPVTSSPASPLGPRDVDHKPPGQREDSKVAAPLTARHGTASAGSSPMAQSKSVVVEDPDAGKKEREARIKAARQKKISEQEAEIARLTAELTKQREAERHRLFERLLFFSEPVYSGGTPVIGPVVVACLEEWGALDPDAPPTQVRTTLDALTKRIRTNRSDPDTLCWWASSLLCMEAVLASSDGKTMPVRIVYDSLADVTAQSENERLAADGAFNSPTPVGDPRSVLEKGLRRLLAESCHLLLQNVFHELQPVLIPSILSQGAPSNEHKTVIEESQSLGNLTSLLEDVYYLMTEHYLPTQLIAALFTQITQYISATLFNLVLDPARSLCCIGAGLQLKMVVSELIDDLTNSNDGLLADSARQFGILKQLADLLMTPKDRLLDEGVRDAICPDINLLQIDQIVSQFRNDSFSGFKLPVVTPLLKNKINLLVAQKFVELEKERIELDADERHLVIMKVEATYRQVIHPSTLPRELIGSREFAFLSRITVESEG
ncbi:DIL domain [Carpediemonas membranifera]|uniref:DIL domain n=1 Tax=Carpediemonas membranifera TaxID=201153 RepID=A0A8J6BFD7_9EUKA|nr:DIL domain [Carpediemonas membranifera]|eukprot:KAG9396312.1 DIL domain [Carpediemonas membranifera]